jgi:hypothetical protein
MSLINEALKKAQRQRTEDTDPTVIVPGTIAKRAQPRSAKSVLVLGAAALLLVLLSVCLTVYLVNRSAPAPTATVASAEPKTSPAEPAATAPAITPANTLPPAPVPAPTPTPLQKETTPITIAPPPAPTPRSTANVATTTAPAVAPPATPPSSAPAPAPTQATEVANAPAISAATTPAPAATSQPDVRIQSYIDSLRITGALPRGAESRVLMNDRVFRLNEMVDRALGIRLIKVEPGLLTFSDGSGVLYVKYF